MSKNSNKSIIDEVKEWAKAKKAAEKANRQPITIQFKLTTLLGWIGIVLAIVAAYLAGVMSADYNNRAYNEAVRTEAVQLVEELKS